VTDFKGMFLFISPQKLWRSITLIPTSIIGSGTDNLKNEDRNTTYVSQKKKHEIKSFTNHYRQKQQ
jgi:hypothetical protein